jgi:hypothetical protein
MVIFKKGEMKVEPFIVIIVAIVAIVGLFSIMQVNTDLVGGATKVSKLFLQKDFPATNIWTKIFCTYPSGRIACDTGKFPGTSVNCNAFCDEEGVINCDISASEETEGEGVVIGHPNSFELYYDSDSYACECIGGTWDSKNEMCCGDDVNEIWDGSKCI